MAITVLLGVLCAISWGLPDVPLARATRAIGIVPTVIGSIAIGLAALVFGDRTLAHTFHLQLAAIGERLADIRQLAGRYRDIAGFAGTVLNATMAACAGAWAGRLGPGRTAGSRSS